VLVQGGTVARWHGAVGKVRPLHLHLIWWDGRMVGWWDGRMVGWSEGCNDKGCNRGTDLLELSNVGCGHCDVGKHG
jgi:hypothetical protein